VTSAGWLRERDARALLLALIILLIGIAITPASRLPLLAALLLMTAIAGYLPLGKALRRTALLLPAGVMFALAAVPARGWAAAGVLAGRASLSALAVVLAAEAASAPRLIGAMARLGCPDALVVVVQFVYRFLFVFAGTVKKMRAAALARGLERAGRPRRFRAAAGSVASLFGIAHGRADRIHRAMLARGYRGRFPSLANERIRLGDAALVVGAVALVFTIRSR
jgi:cobalt/nickel transport system permease protein